MSARFLASKDSQNWLGIVVLWFENQKQMLQFDCVGATNSESPGQIIVLDQNVRTFHPQPRRDDRDSALQLPTGVCGGGGGGCLSSRVSDSTLSYLSARS